LGLIPSGRCPNLSRNNQETAMADSGPVIGADEAAELAARRAVLEVFHPAVADWFGRHFPAPTGAQAQAWPAIKSGEHTLIAAPTGSGKTLAAFLAAIDSLVRQG